jgi:hypothetical protein
VNINLLVGACLSIVVVTIIFSVWMIAKIEQKRIDEVLSLRVELLEAHAELKRLHKNSDKQSRLVQALSVIEADLRGDIPKDYSGFFSGKKIEEDKRE